MHPQVKLPRRPNEKWLKKAFARLSDYLNKQHPDRADKMMMYMSFYGNTDGRFYYRNWRTKGSVVMDQSGKISRCDENAFYYEESAVHKDDRRTVEREPILCHSNVTHWMDKCLTKKQIEKFGAEISYFLQVFWGPICNYDFEDLRVGYPKLGVRIPYTLYIYPVNFPRRLILQFVGDELIERNCSYAQMEKFRRHERDLFNNGWQVLTVMQEFMDEHSEKIHTYLSHANFCNRN